jgi:hypothetical protein
MRRVSGKRNSGDVATGRPANFNRRKTKAIAGDHLVQCDITGQVCLRSETKKTWRGLLVSKQNWDPKHPQLTINVPPEDVSVRDARPFKSSFEEVGSDIVDEGNVNITDQDVEYT